MGTLEKSTSVFRVINGVPWHSCGSIKGPLKRLDTIVDWNCLGQLHVHWENYISISFHIYDRGDSFPFDFEPNGIPFGSKSKGKLSPRSYLIQCERKWKYIFSSAAAENPPYSVARAGLNYCRILYACSKSEAFMLWQWMCEVFSHFIALKCEKTSAQWQWLRWSFFCVAYYDLVSCRGQLLFGSTIMILILVGDTCYLGPLVNRGPK